MLADLIIGLQAEESLHSDSGTSVGDSWRHVEDDLGEGQHLHRHALSDS